VQDLKSQALRALRVFVCLNLITLAVLFAAFLFWWTTGQDVGMIFRDPVAVLEGELLLLQQVPPESRETALQDLRFPFYMGWISQLGAVMWTCGAAICFLTWYAAPPGRTGVPNTYFLSAGGITTMLMLDDLYLLHERAVPLHLGIGENYLYLVYASLLLLHLVWFRNAILKTEFLLLGAALGVFALALFIDGANLWLPQIHFFEDGTKFGAIVTWTGYHVRTARDQFVPAD